MTTTTLLPENIQAAAAKIPENKPFFMLNLLRYNGQANYDDSKDYAPCTGREAYHQRYIPAFIELTKNDGIQVFFIGTVLTKLVAPAEEEWEEVALIQYPSYKVFQQLVESDSYKEIAYPHRTAALNDWRLIATATLEMPL